MANPVIAAPHVVGEILEIDVSDIDISERLRPIDPHWAAALAKIMAVEGQRTPIEVCRVPGRRGFTLVAGGHRLVAAQQRCWLFIRAIVVDGDQAERRAREVSENLWRKGLDPVDRAAFVAELYTLLRTRASIQGSATPQQIAVQARWQKALKKDAADASDMVSLAYGWTSEIADQLQLSTRTIERDLLLHNRLLPGVVQLLRGHPIMANAGQLGALAKLEPEQQRSIAQLLADGVVKSVGEARDLQAQRVKPDAETKRFNAVIGNLGRMGVSERQAVLDQIAGMYFQACRRAVAKAGSFTAKDA